MKKLIVITLLIVFFGVRIFSQGFEDISYILGPNMEHSFDQIIDEMPLRVSAGVAVADVNNDNFFDIVFSLGDNQCVELLLNDGKGFYVDATENYGLGGMDFRSSSPHFFNYNNDEFIDLIIGSVDGTPPILFENINGKGFVKIELPEFDALENRNTITITSLDYNNDGHQDLFFSHWLETFEENHFWKNLGNGHFQSADFELGFYSPHDGPDFTHTANFIDINEDGYKDLLLCSDFATSQIWMNDQGVGFSLNTNVVLDDENAMGSAIGDFDNDGDFDWFVTSVFDDDGVLEGNWGGTGNKFYVNNGNGDLIEQSAEYGLENASWGWGTTFADLNNDGFLDIIVVNGWPQGSDQFKNDRLKVFISEYGKYFNELASDFNLIDTLQGRGVSCVDFDNDGKLDILVSNYRGTAKLYQNELRNENHYLKLNLWESEANAFGHGVKATVFTDNSVQNQIVTNGSNYVSQNPSQLHFGLGKSAMIDSVFITWTDNSIHKFYNLSSDQLITIKKKSTNSVEDIDSYVYPNPSQLSISAVIRGFEEKNVDCHIIDGLGQPIKQINSFSIYENSLFLNDIDISELRSGQYYIKVNLKEKSPIALPFIKI